MVDVEGCCASSVSPFCFIYIYTFKCFRDSTVSRRYNMSYFSAYWKVLKVNTVIVGIIVTVLGLVFAVDKAKEELSR